jgi:hypothetical protein
VDWLPGLGRRGSDMPAGERFCNEVRLIAGMQFVAQILDVALDRSWRDSELLRALFGRKSARDALQDLALTLRQTDEIFLLPRKIHHASP